MGRKLVSGAKGFSGRVFILGTEICVESWEVTSTADEEDVTNSCSMGIAEFEYGVVQHEGSLEGTWDVAQNPYDSPPNLQAGTQGSATLYVHSNAGSEGPDGPNFSGSLAVVSTTISVPARGKVAYSVNFKLTGTVSYPTGNPSSSGS